MNQYWMVVLIVTVVMIAGIFKSRHKHLGARADFENDPETLRMKEDLKMLRERVQVLERIATDRENTLERQIEALRDR